MNARVLLALQLTSLMTMLSTAESLFENRIVTIIFATAFFVFARCSIYISKNCNRLLKELERERRTYKTRHQRV